MQSFLCGWFVAAIIACVAATARGEVDLPEPNRSDPIAVSADAANRWMSGSYDVWLLSGNCRIQQGAADARCREALLWIERADGAERSESKIIAYLEGDVELARNGPSAPAKVKDQTWLGRFTTNREIQVYAGQVSGEPSAMPPIYQRAMERRNPISADTVTRSEVRQAQFAAPAGQPEVIPKPQARQEQPALRVRRVRVFPRSDVPYQLDWKSDPRGGNMWIAVISGGVNMVIDTEGALGSIDISTDRMVVWTVNPMNNSQDPPDFSGNSFVDGRTPLEIYMEGNIVFRQGERTIYAERMYYNEPNRTGTILNAEILTPVPTYEGKLRLKSDMIQQTGRDSYYAQNTFITSSRMGEPGYRLQSGDIFFEDIQSPMIDPLSGQVLLDPKTNQELVEHNKLATSSNNFLFIGPVPVFYWPVLSTNLEEPTYYIRRARAKYDRVYGTQILTTWNGYELLGVKKPPPGTDLEFSFDYLGLRGFGAGGSFTYNLPGIFEMPGQVGGLFDYWGIPDHGTDNLGVDRSALVPEKEYRFRMFWQNRQMLPNDWQLSTELGYISDRNFLQSYYEREWDTLKDESTGVELKQTQENRSFSISADVRLNNFFTETEWLPRADHFWLGQSLLNDTFTWYEHSMAGYARFRPANTPANPQDQPFYYLPWETVTTPTLVQPAPERYGEVFSTRQEIDWPFQLGDVKIVPYALGELAHWGQDLYGDSLNRAYGQAGVRASLPIWSVDPSIKSDLFNLNGIAHKVVFEAEFAFADSNQNLDQLPLYNPLDDNSVEAERQRFRIYSYNSPPNVFPLWLDERYYAVRTGLGSWVTEPSTEVVDDLTVFRLGARQRWQTKRGTPGNEHIIDWITLDTNISLFPNPDRDDFGQVVGLANYNFSWHLGDRLTLLSDGDFDFFYQGQKTYSVGAYLSRPPRGSFYLGFRQIEGPLDSRVITLSYTYWMSPKWISTFGTTYDFGQEGNIGQTFGITRIGESFLVNLSFTVDPARNDWGVGFSIEPRFLSKSRLANIGGAHIPVAGANGLE
ncbi:MAG: organic solvent tolerance protein OstA [Thermoguttaceae bacterium]